MIGDRVSVVIDRPLGSYHPQYKDMCYSVNYGYVEGVIVSSGVRFQEQYFRVEIITE